MKIYCKQTTTLEIPASKLVNKVGKYIYKNVDGAYKMTMSSNICDVYLTVYYQIPPSFSQAIGEEVDDVHEMNINLNITTYQNKLRVNLIEMTNMEKTISSDTFKPEVLQNVKEACELILDKVKRHLVKEFRDYDFIF